MADGIKKPIKKAGTAKAWKAAEEKLLINEW
jgi:hypothetical protein